MTVKALSRGPSRVEATLADGRKIAEARIIFVNGLDFEGWLQRLIDATKNHGLLVPLGNGVKARSNEEGLDPHAWQDVANVRIYVEEIRDALAGLISQALFFDEKSHARVKVA